MLNYGPLANEGEEDLDLRNAGGQLVTLLPGASFFSSVDSFAMIRGGHIDACVLGGYQVSERGDLANWMRPGRGIGSMGGAMDLVIGAKQVLVAMDHVTREGEPKIVNECSYPLTGKACVTRIVTNLAVIDVTPEGLLLLEIAPGLAVSDVRSLTGARLIPADNLKEMDF
jgi:3-oxoacid CoA-transferase subunit B